MVEVVALERGRRQCRPVLSLVGGSGFGGSRSTRAGQMMFALRSGPGLLDKLRVVRAITGDEGGCHTGAAQLASER